MRFIKTAKEKEGIDKILKHYEKPLYNKAKTNHSRLGWRTKQGQIERFQVMLDVGVGGEDFVLDYGCGLGDLLGYMKKVKKYHHVDYLGVDINNKYINESKEKYGDGFFKSITDYKSINGKFDWFLASGVFTVHTSNRDLYNVIDYFYKHVRKGISFNLLRSPYYENERGLKYKEISVRGYNKDDISKYFKKKYGNIKVVDISYDEFNVYIYK